MKEFNWLGECTTCNIDCCHNTNKYIPENECVKPGAIIPKPSGTEESNAESYDNRPLECRLFPFDVKEIDNKLVWVKWDSCHATPKLNYEKFMDFFERSFSRTIPLEYIKQYVERRKLNNSEKPLTNQYIVVRELKWTEK